MRASLPSTIITPELSSSTARTSVTSGWAPPLILGLVPRLGVRGDNRVSHWYVIFEIEEGAEPGGMGDTMTPPACPAPVVFAHTEQQVGIRGSASSSTNVILLLIIVVHPAEIDINAGLGDSPLLHYVDPFNVKLVKHHLDFVGVHYDVIASLINDL